MTKRAGRSSSRLSLRKPCLGRPGWMKPRSIKQCAAILLLAGIFAALSASPCFADEPKADPSGIATGDKTMAVDAAGNSFVVTEPTDKSAPDYAANKKAYDDYQANTDRQIPVVVLTRR